LCGGEIEAALVMPSEAKHFIDGAHHNAASVKLQCGNASFINR
jgi:hypothetical protein